MSNTSSQHSEDKTITLPISRFIEYLVGSADKRYHVHADDATVLALKDSAEVFAHVEFPDKDNTLDMPCVWRAKEWKVDAEKRARDKANAAKERLAANIFHENIDRVSKRLVQLTGLDIERVRVTAIAMVKRGNREELAKMGITLEEWDKQVTVVNYIK